MEKPNWPLLKTFYARASEELNTSSLARKFAVGADELFNERSLRYADISMILLGCPSDSPCLLRY